MKEREKIVVTSLVMLMLLAWLGFPLHRSNRFAGSAWGGLFGVTGAILMLVPLAYLIVKRNKKFKKSVTKYVSMRTLLSWHIYAGVLGPILVIIHSGHKYNSTLGIALTAMTLLVVISGFIGRYLMSGFSKEIKAKKAMLADLQTAYDQAVVEVSSNPATAQSLQPFSGFFSRLTAGLFLTQSSTNSISPSNDSMTLIRLAESIADVEYAIKTHQDFKRWFGKWLKLHIAISFILYGLMSLHIWAAVHFGLRWFDMGGPYAKSSVQLRVIDATVPVNVMAVSTNTKAAEEFSTYFGRMFRRHWRNSVKVHGIETTVFDYAGIANEVWKPESNFQKAVSALTRIDPNLFSGDDFEKAFWINIYNFAAMKMAAENYPVPSIIDPKISADDPWGVEAIVIGSTPYSLKEIENAILLKKFDDPRIVLAISCAAVSCPDRSNEIFSGDRIDEQLETIIRTLLLNPDKGLTIDRDKRVMTLSWILKADKRLFENSDQGVLGFVRQYAAPDVARWIDQNASEVTIEYFQHDWGLNDIALADSRFEDDQRGE